mmetsp:Transcript_65089/g.209781  ORF Transcript_65089/g.209781 Transcript_65089/m.209781 type:complete len:365 (-) Transcript_65089:199-1293(-)
MQLCLGLLAHLEVPPSLGRAGALFRGLQQLRAQLHGDTVARDELGLELAHPLRGGLAQRCCLPQVLEQLHGNVQATLRVRPRQPRLVGGGCRRGARTAFCRGPAAAPGLGLRALGPRPGALARPVRAAERAQQLRHGAVALPDLGLEPLQLAGEALGRRLGLLELQLQGQHADAAALVHLIFRAHDLRGVPAPAFACACNAQAPLALGILARPRFQLRPQVLHGGLLGSQGGGLGAGNGIRLPQRPQQCTALLCLDVTRLLQSPSGLLCGVQLATQRQHLGARLLCRAELVAKRQDLRVRRSSSSGRGAATAPLLRDLRPHARHLGEHTLPGRLKLPHSSVLRRCQLCGGRLLLLPLFGGNRAT